MTATTIPAAPAATPRTELNQTQKIVVWAVAAGAIFIATLGFLGSYAAVADLAADQQFGKFAKVFPIAIDAGIGVLLALDLLLTWLRIPFPLLRPMAWAFTAATIAFNAATSWPHLLGTSMHAAIPALFVVIVEAARHAVGKLAQLHAGAHYENPPMSRWILAPFPTYRIWRRMRMWNIRSYSDVVEMERETKVLRATLKARHGFGWRKEAAKRELLALRLAKLGTPVGQTLAARFEVAADRPASRQRPATAIPGITERPASLPAATSTKSATALPASATPKTASGSSAYLPLAETPNATRMPAPALAASDLPTPVASPAATANETAPTVGTTSPGSKSTTTGEQRDLDEVADTFRKLAAHLGKSPSDAALADALGVGRSRAQQLRTAAIAAGHNDLEKPLRAAS
ncbi:hypothetical protein KCMC57_65250 (plasmid) [Kitasatospora sp. CMC57]|uniref:DUF2637 domain-containing protein n=1 Tax=Kitasatospora sp. CMC57 TaxID=3231513 RepID=A0AB33K3I4_9ACTN